MTRASRILLLALSIASFISASAAAQEKESNLPPPNPARLQSLNQIVGFSDKALAEQLTVQAKAKKIEVAQAKADIPDSQAVVIPPPPNVVKLSAHSISIPADKVAADSKYEQKPVVASQATVGSVYGVRRDPFTRRAKFHSGVDIKARRGDPVGASQRGVVEFAGWYYGYGNLIILGHGGGVRTHYAHLSSFDLQVGGRVERGTIIGRAGSTGRATSPHLHYEVRVDGMALDPFRPLALDASSEYFKQTRPAAPPTAVHDLATRPRRVN